MQLSDKQIHVGQLLFWFLNSLPNGKILDISRLKDVVDDNFKFDKK